MFPVTLVAVVVAMTTTAIAWRLSRGERRRSEARISALTAALAGPDPGDFRGSRRLDRQVDRYRTADRPAAVPVVAPVVPDVQTRPIARQATVTHGSPALAPPTPPRPRAAVVQSAADIPLRFGTVDDGANAAPLAGDLFEPRHSS